jgi:ribosome maturation factor RimP
MTKMTNDLHDRLALIVQTMRYEFVGCEWQGKGRHAALRIYIDSETGASLHDCSRVSRQVSAMLDVEYPLLGHYTLEVSSPGLDRPLFELAHYQRQLGKRVHVRVNTPVYDQRKFTGILLRVEGNNIHLLVDAEEKVLSFSDIEKANVVDVT